MTILKIEKMGNQGDGIAYLDGQVVFVPNGVIGDEVNANINGNRAEIIEITKPSSDRITPECQYYSICGGCSLQHISDSGIQSFKTGLIKDELGIDIDLVENAHISGRRRAKFNAKKINNEITLGYMGSKSHDLINIESCLILSENLDKIIPNLRELCRTLLKPNDSISLSVTECDNGIDVDIIGLRPIAKWSKAEQEALSIAATKSNILRLTLNGELAFQHATPIVKFDGFIVEIPPNSFLQATKSCEDVIATQMMEWAKGAKRVVDLFSGVGTFSLRLKKIAETNAYELNVPSVEVLKKAAKATAGGHTLQAFARDLFRQPVSPLELKNIDLVVLDPARAGANSQAKLLVKSKVKKVIYISCDPKSFAEDAKTLKEGGFRLKKVKGFDQFRYSPHVELMGLFTR